MKLDDLSKQAKAGKIASLDLVSVEGGSYVLHAVIDGQSHPVHDGNDQTLHVASVDEARKCLEGVPEVPFFLVQPAVYDEMVGHAPGENTASREPIKFRSSL